MRKTEAGKLELEIIFPFNKEITIGGQGADCAEPCAPLTRYYIIDDLTISKSMLRVNRHYNDTDNPVFSDTLLCFEGKQDLNI